MPDTPRLAALREKIQLLAAIDPDLQVFGASHHRHQVGVPLDDDGVAALEARFGALPDEYRVLVRAFGTRSAGPYYGLEAPVVPEDPQHPLQPDPARAFPCDGATPYDAKLPGSASPLDGTVVLAQQGCGGRSVLVMRGPRAGEVWSDWTSEQGKIAPEAKSVLAWYEQWIERALLDWIERSAPRIAIDGAASSDELEAVALVFELVERAAVTQPQYLRTLGYLHLREERWPDAEAKFVAAAKVPDAEEKDPRLALDRGRLALKRGRADDAIASVRLGLASQNLWYSTRDELRDTLERAFLLVGRTEEALAVLDQRAQERSFSLDLHHRLARERLARNDVGKAGAVLERPDGRHPRRVEADRGTRPRQLRSDHRGASCRRSQRRCRGPRGASGADSRRELGLEPLAQLGRDQIRVARPAPRDVATILDHEGVRVIVAGAALRQRLRAALEVVGLGERGANFILDVFGVGPVVLAAPPERREIRARAVSMAPRPR